MFNWYARAQVCYAYLADVDTGVRRDSRGETQSQDQDIVEIYEEVCLDLRLGNQLHIEQRRWYDTELHSQTTTTTAIFDSRGHGTYTTDATTCVAFGDSRWFQRGWTPQELIAPCRLKFYGRSWEPLGERDEELLHTVIECTGLVPLFVAILEHYERLQKHNACRGWRVVRPQGKKTKHIVYWESLESTCLSCTAKLKRHSYGCRKSWLEDFETILFLYSPS